MREDLNLPIGIGIYPIMIECILKKDNEFEHKNIKIMENKEGYSEWYMRMNDGTLYQFNDGTKVIL